MGMCLGLMHLWHNCWISSDAVFKLKEKMFSVLSQLLLILCRWAVAVCFTSKPEELRAKAKEKNYQCWCRKTFLQGLSDLLMAGKRYWDQCYKKRCMESHVAVPRLAKCFRSHNPSDNCGHSILTWCLADRARGHGLLRVFITLHCKSNLYS